MNAMHATPDSIPELRDAVSRCVDALSSRRGWFSVLYLAVVSRIKIRRYTHIVCRSSDKILDLIKDDVEGKVEPDAFGMDAYGKSLLEISEKQIAGLRRMHNDDSQLVNHLKEMRRSGLGLQAWILRPVQHYDRMIVQRLEQFEEISTQIQQHWPWLDEERIRTARKEYAANGGVELAELLQDGPS